MITSISILGCVLLGLATAVSLEPPHCRVDLRLTPSDDVLAGTNTPVFFFRSDKNSPLGHRLIHQQDAIANLKSQSPFFEESDTRRIDNNNECSQSQEWVRGLNYSLECAAPSTIYPKVVVIVDNGIYVRYANKSNKLTKLLEYVLAYWNGVDLNFRTLENPKVRFNIAGIIVEEHAHELPFLSMDPNGKLNPLRSLSSLERFSKSNGSSWSHHFGHYDIATVMTSTDMVYSSNLGRFSKDSMCNDNISGPPQRILFPDDHGWLRICRLSEMIANSFDIDYVHCQTNESAVTNYLQDITKDLPDWSKCYVDAFKKRFNTRRAACYFKKPNVISPLPRVLPGQILSCNGQCDITRGTKCCMNESICQNLMCQMEDGCKPIGIYAADGTACGNEKICFRRKCVLKKDVE